MKQSERKKLQIIAAAEQEFKNYGLAGTNMDKIAAAAQVSKRTVYNHFASKDELFQAIIFGLLEQLDSAAEFDFDENMPLREQLRLIAINEVTLLTSENFIGLARVTYMEMLNNQSFANEIAAKMGNCELLFSQWIEAACQKNKLEVADAAYASQQFIYQLKGFIFYPLLYGLETMTQEKIDKVIDNTIDMFMAQFSVEK